MNEPLKRKRGQRGLGKRPRMVLMSVRLPPEVAAYYRSLPKYTKKLRDALIAHAAAHVGAEADRA